MFIEKITNTPLEFRRNDIATANALRKHIVPTKSTPNALMAFGGAEEQDAQSENPKIDT